MVCEVKQERRLVGKSQGPFYNLSDLVRDCSLPGLVFVRKPAREDAKLFGFDTQARILEFFSIGEFNDLKHQNSGTIDHDPDKGACFDAYIFNLGQKTIYCAFYKRHNGIWVIKSFHIPNFGENSIPLSHTPFEILERLKK